MEYEQIIKHWKDKKIATVVDLRESLSSYSIIFAYNSGAIENPEITYHNTRIYGKLQHICIANLRIYMHLRMEMVAWDAR